MAIIKHQLTKEQSFQLNFGPVHPSGHGVLRLLLNMKGETVQELNPHIGLLHRGTEKLIEYKTGLQALPYFDRLDYVSTLAMEHSFCLGIERLTNSTVTDRVKAIRVLFCELTRILNHLLGITCYAMDTGALSPFLFAFEEREKILEFYERASGARMHAAFFRPGGLSADIPIGLLNSIHNWSLQFGSRIDEIEELLTTNRIFKQRIVNIGILNKNDALSWGASGVLLRASGIPYDLRKSQHYEYYNHVEFDVPVGTNSDCYDRYLLRIEEMRQSLRIIRQIINIIPNGPVKPQNSLFNYSKPMSRSDMKVSMEGLINHFKSMTTGTALNSGECYVATEAPKGEFGVLISTNGSAKPYRVKIKSPDYNSLQSIKQLGQDHFLADVPAIIGSIDIVFGSIDR